MSGRIWPGQLILDFPTYSKASILSRYNQIDIRKITHDIMAMQKESEERHQEVLHLIEELSDASSDGNSTISKTYSGSHASSTSFTMLPSVPKIFHGRESELVEILELFSHGVPRVAILVISSPDVMAVGSLRSPGGIPTGDVEMVTWQILMRKRTGDHRHNIWCILVLKDAIGDICNTCHNPSPSRTSVYECF
ncbi:hypothetical protein C8R47DRAFT_1295307 [Mycena vitilis]|nr:hypothetical protein C8R47DRAFT_1295307 [Mycena vitilis]